MKYIKQFVLLSCFILYLSILSCEKAKQNSALVTSFTNKVEYKIDNSSDWMAINQNTRLLTGSKIRTGTKSKAELKYIDGTISRIGSNSVLRIKEINEETGRTNLILELGKMYVKVTSTDKKMNVETPTAVASIMGTEFFVLNDDKNKSHIATLEGLVAAVNKTNNDKKVVKPGWWVNIEPNKALPEPDEFEFEKFVKDEEFLLGSDYEIPMGYVYDNKELSLKFTKMEEKIKDLEGTIKHLETKLKEKK